MLFFVRRRKGVLGTMLVLPGLCQMSNGKRERYSAAIVSLRLDLWLEVIVAMLDF